MNSRRGQTIEEDSHYFGGAKYHPADNSTYEKPQLSPRVFQKLGERHSDMPNSSVYQD